MGLSGTIGSVQAAVQAVCGDQDARLCKALRAATESMLLVGNCQLSQMAKAGSASVGASSHEKRLQRLMRNERLDAEVAMDAWAQAILADAGEVRLFLDETAHGSRLRSMKLSCQMGGRSVPLMWACYLRGELPASQDQIVLHLLHRLVTASPQGLKITLMADRGLAWPAVVAFCREHGWDFTLRLQHHTRVKLAGGLVLRVGELAPQPGITWRGSAEVFQNAGWYPCNVVAHWPRGQKQPWLLITSQAPTLWRCWQYRKRMRIEQSFRDEKSHGFQWRRSRLRNPQRAARLLLVMAIAMAIAIHRGRNLIKSGGRTWLEPRHKRIYSDFALGLRYLHRLTLARAPAP